MVGLRAVACIGAITDPLRKRPENRIHGDLRRRGGRRGRWRGRAPPETQHQRRKPGLRRCHRATRIAAMDLAGIEAW
jgi:hypothetical protein